MFTIEALSIGTLNQVFPYSNIQKIYYWETKNDFNTIKLADFGLSAKIGFYFSYKRLDKKCGTAAYMAPEVILKKEYSKVLRRFNP